MEIQKKLTVLSQMAKELNQQHVLWAVGASLLLYLKGKVSDFHDIDIMVAESDIKKVTKILSSFGVLQPRTSNTQYKTKQFLEFIIDGVDVDVMAGFTIVMNGKDYYFPLKKENISDHIKINGVSIPLQSLKEWRTYYRLMGRHEKVKIIDQ